MTRQPFENLKYRIHNVPKSADLFAEFPDLEKHREALTTYIEKVSVKDEFGKDDTVEEVKTVENANGLIRYLIYLYDKKSDLIRQEPDLRDRKKRAAELSGFTDYQKDFVLEKGFYFLTRVFNDRKFREWCTNQQELEEKQQARWKPINEDETKDQKQYMEAHEKKGKLREQAMAIHKALDALEPEIFGDNEDVKNLANELLTTPEKIAAAYY
jgi:hypothetical protein